MKRTSSNRVAARFAQVGFTLALVVTVSAAQCARVRTVSGSIAGEIVESGREGVVVESSKGRVTVPVGELLAVLYDDEPAELSQARINAAGGGYANALERLDELPAGKSWAAPIDREIAFLRAICSARLAERSGEGIGDAGRQLTAFLREHADTPFYYASIEALADLLVVAGRTEAAIKRYQAMTRSESSVYRDRALVAIGRAHAQTNQHAEALAAYERALEVIDTQRALSREAARGRVVSLAELGETEAAIEAGRELVRSAGDDSDRLAAAYNALGRCYLAAGSTREALYAFLHTDLVHNDDADTHAEALAFLSDLWRDIGRRAQADDAATRLKRRYGRSVWALRGADG